MRDAGLTYQKPERQYFEVDEKARQKWLRTEVPRIRRTVREFRAILYFQDESNVSLTAFLGKTWAMCGQTPRVPVTGKRGGVSAMSALSGQGRLLFRLFDKRICSGEVIYFLDQMLQFHKGRHLVVVMDQAPPHTSQMTTAYIEGQRRLHVFYLPKYSPDWNPDEGLTLSAPDLAAPCGPDSIRQRAKLSPSLAEMRFWVNTWRRVESAKGRSPPIPLNDHGVTHVRLSG